jgi:hypothetical protein
MQVMLVYEGSHDPMLSQLHSREWSLTYEKKPCIYSAWLPIKIAIIVFVSTRATPLIWALVWDFPHVTCNMIPLREKYNDRRSSFLCSLCDSATYMYRQPNWFSRLSLNFLYLLRMWYLVRSPINELATW